MKSTRKTALSLALLILIATASANLSAQVSDRRNTGNQASGLVNELQQFTPSYPAMNAEQPQFDSASRSSSIDLAKCNVIVIDDIDVPAHISGPILKMNFREGQFVQADDEIARIDDTLAQLELESARRRLDATRTKSESDIEVRYARAGLEVAKKEYEQLKELYARRSGSRLEYERAKHAAQEAALKIEKSKHDMMLATKDVLVEEVRVKSAEEILKQHVISSPIDGNVLKVSRQAGEWVKEGEKVLQIVRMDRLYVESQDIDPTRYNAHEIMGKPVTITVHMARGEKAQLQGRIVLVDPQRRSRNYFTVRAEVENRAVDGHWLLNPMASVSMRIHLDSESAVDSAHSEQNPAATDGNINR